MTDIVGKLWGFCHIQSIVRCMKPDPRKSEDFTIHDPAAGTGGFLVCAYEWLMEQTGGSLERSEAKRILTGAYSGTELVPRSRRLALMNLYLHGIQANIRLGDAIYEPKIGGPYDCVMTNPPFGTKGANQAATTLIFARCRERGFGFTTISTTLPGHQSLRS